MHNIPNHPVVTAFDLIFFVFDTQQGDAKIADAVLKLRMQNPQDNTDGLDDDLFESERLR